MKMVIYGEFLFIENFISTLLLILLTGKLVGYMPRFPGLIAASLLGAGCSFMIFLPLTIFVSIILRIATGFACIYIAFGSKYIFIKTGIFFVVTFTCGGMVMAVLLWMQESAINHQGIVYIESVTYLKLLSIGILAFGFVYWFVKLVRRHNVGTAVLGKVCIVIDGKQYYFNAFVDSGNSLREPIMNRPVILIDSKGTKKLHISPNKFQKDFFIVPYKAVGVDCGLLEGIKIDKIIFEKKVVEGVCLAFYEGSFRDYEVLLHRDFLEGGLLEKNS